jgi:hypothetical protein
MGTPVQIFIQVTPFTGDGVNINNTAVVNTTSNDPDTSNNSDTLTTALSDSTGPSGDPFITLSPTCGPAGQSVVITGYGWPSGGSRELYFIPQGSSQVSLGGFSGGDPWTETITIPAGTGNGTHIIRAERVAGGVAIATNKNFQIPCPSPDFIADQPVLIATPPIDGADILSYEVVISNIGQVDAAGQFFVSLYYDPSPTPGAGDTGISSSFQTDIVAVTDLAQGDSKTITLTANAGLGSDGNHTVYVVVDSSTDITEMDETNNISPPLTVFVGSGSPPTPTPTSTPVVSPTPGPSPTPNVPGSLAGITYLTAAGGQPLPQSNVEVSVYDESNPGSPPLVTFSASDPNTGLYFFSNLNAGSYTVTGCITVDGTDYFYLITGVVINAGQQTTRNIFLEEGICL